MRSERLLFGLFPPAPSTQEVSPRCASMIRESRRSAGRHRQGFTLLEMLTVVMILAVLIALLLPAVQQAREAARRYACQNNLAQIGLALQNYEMVHERLPPGTVNPTGPIRSENQGYHIGWMVQILPHLEHENVYAQFNFSMGLYDEENYVPARCTIPSFACPSSPSGGVVVVNLATGNYAGCHHDVEAPIDVDNHGVLFLNSSIRYRDLHDGSAATIFVGETSGGLGWAAGTRATLRNTGGPINGRTVAQGVPIQVPLSGPELDAYLLAVGGFSSSHTGGANFLLGNGSVRFISESVSLPVLQTLAHRDDGSLPGRF